MKARQHIASAWIAVFSLAAPAAFADGHPVRPVRIIVRNAGIEAQ